MEKSSAHQNPATEKPSIRLSAIKMMTALMTKVKSPRVRMLSGKVRRINKGRTSAFKIPKIKAANKAVLKALTVTPGRT